MPTRDTRLDSIVCVAVELTSADDRAAYIAQACANDPDLQGRVERLVAAHFRAGSFLQNPAAEAAATGAIYDAAGQPPPSEAPGAVLGPYKLLQPIGEGG